MGGYPHHGPNQ
jgi:hypothetical protein